MKMNGYKETKYTDEKNNERETPSSLEVVFHKGGLPLIKCYSCLTLLPILPHKKKKNKKWHLP